MNSDPRNGGGCESCRYNSDEGSRACRSCIIRENGDFSNWEPKAEAPAVLPENPKAIYGRAKPSIGLVPAGALIPLSGVFALGAQKYGPFNWRRDPVQAETYVHAGLRHLLSWWDGEDTDPESGESHLAHAAACMSILLDAMACGTMIDNRPTAGTAADLIRARTKALPPARAD